MAAIALFGAAMSVSGAALANGLVVHWPIDVGDGDVARDASGNGHDGKVVGATLLPRASGSALRLTGIASYVEGEDDPLPASEKGLTIALWIHPDAVSSVSLPLVARDGAYALHLGQTGDLRFTLKGTPEPAYVRSGVLRPMGTWIHVVVSYDGTFVRYYLDGQSFHRGYTYRVKTQQLAPGGRLRVGWEVKASPDDISPVSVDDVRIYHRALSETEVQALYRDSAPPTVNVKPYVYDFAKVLVLRLTAPSLSGSPKGSTVRMSIRKSGESMSVLARQVDLPPDGGASEVRLNVGDLDPGSYQIAAQVLAPGGEALGVESVTALVWPQPPTWTKNKDARVLNALVTELVNVGSPAGKAYSFINPRPGWVFFSATAKSASDALGIRMTLHPAPTAGGPPLLVDQAGRPGVAEAMRFLIEGKWTVTVNRDSADVDRLIVRAVPEISHRVPCKPNVPEYGLYGSSFLAKDTTPNIHQTTIFDIGVVPAFDDWIREWLQQGRKLNKDRNPVGMNTDAARNKTVEQAAKWWGDTLARPDVQSVTLDEVSHPESGIAVQTTKALQILASEREQRFPGEGISAYCYGYAGMYRNSPTARTFLKAISDGGGHLVHEVYLSSEPDEPTARAVLDTMITSFMSTALRLYPRAAAESTVMPSAMAWPGYAGHDMYPDVDYRVFVETQFRTVATQSVFFGLQGVSRWGAPTADEEILRLYGRLMRHYCIEGRTDRLLKDPYRLRHVSNPCFDEGIAGWKVGAAESGSVFLGSTAQCVRVVEHWVQFGGRADGGRNPRPGDNMLVMRRSAAKPNTVSQTVKGLSPGRLYSLRFFTANYGDLVEAKAASKALAETPMKPAAIRAKLDGVAVIPQQSFVSHTLYGYVNGKYGSHECGMKFHRIVFRAIGKDARLTFSDSPTDPGGPAGEENLLTFVKVQPYLE